MRNSILRPILFLVTGTFLVLFGIPVKAASTVGKSLGERFDSRLKAFGIDKSEFSVWIGKRNSAGEIQSVFEHQAQAPRIPASLSKVFTAAAALKHLKPGFKFRTLLATDGKVDAKTLTGNLYLIGGGDPSFISESMWFLVNEFRRTGISKIKGNILVDESRFDEVKIDKERESVRVDRAYDAPVGGMSMNWNSVNVHIRPGQKAGDSCQVFVDIQSPYLTVSNQCVTTKTGSQNLKTSIVVERKAAKPPHIDHIVVSGKAAVGAAEVTIYKNISQPALWSGFNLRVFLEQRGIELEGSVKVGTAPKNHLVLATAESKSISDIVSDMSKWSNNYVAEMLTKNLAAQSGESPATMNTGLSVIREYVLSLPLGLAEKDEFIFLNPAGFSRDNRVSARFLGHFLEAVKSEFEFFPEMLVGLPISGVDGTLRNRMKEGAGQRKLRAKTGLLNGVAGLGGYFSGPDGSPWTVVLLYNGRMGLEEKARGLIDQFCEDIVDAVQDGAGLK